MEYRQLGRSGFTVPVLSLGTGTFGGGTEFFKAWGSTDAKGATRLVDMCLDAGISMFDSADVYSKGLAEEVLGAAIKGRRNKVIISTKATFRFSDRPNDVGSSRHHLTEAVNGSLKRLGTDYIDLFQLHGFDAMTPQEEVLGCLDDLVRAGKIRYIGCSNFSGWHLMKALATSEKYGLARHVAHQAYYSLVGRSYEWELMPLGLDQGVSAVVWSPLGWGRLTGKIRRGTGLPKESRLHVTADDGPPVAEEYLYRVMDAIDEVAKETGKIRAADRHQLAAPAPDRCQCHCRRPQRRTAQAKSRQRGLEIERGPNRQARRRQRHDENLSLLAPVRIRRAQSFTGLRSGLS